MFVPESGMGRLGLRQFWDVPGSASKSRMREEGPRKQIKSVVYFDQLCISTSFQDLKVG